MIEDESLKSGENRNDDWTRPSTNPRAPAVETQLYGFLVWQIDLAKKNELIEALCSCTSHSALLGSLLLISQSTASEF